MSEKERQKEREGQRAVGSTRILSEYANKGIKYVTSILRCKRGYFNE